MTTDGVVVFCFPPQELAEYEKVADHVKINQRGRFTV